MNKLLLKLVGIVFFGIILPLFIKEGMFVDGIFYATISRNLHLGKGSFWVPFFTETLSPEFFAQPPLFFYVQSWFYTLFGNGLWVDKLLGFFSLLLIILGLIFIWKRIDISRSKELKLYVLPVLIFVLIEHNYRGYCNNVLEILVTLFALLSVLLLFKNIKSNKIWELILASIFIVLGFFTKGLVALFPLMFFLLWGIFIENNWKTLLKKSCLLFILCLAIIVLVFLFNNAAAAYLKAYFKVQMQPVIDNTHSENRAYRLMIVWVLIKDNLLNILLILTLLITKKISPRRFKNNQFLFWLFVGLSASLPIMVSGKQAGYYVLPSLPYFAVAMAALVLPAIQEMKVNKRAHIVVNFMLVISIGISFFNINTINKRNKNIVSDVHKIEHIISGRQTISYYPSQRINYLIPSTFYRYYQVSLDTAKSNKHDYLVLDNKVKMQYNEGYKEIDLDLKTLKLFKNER